MTTYKSLFAAAYKAGRSIHLKSEDQINRLLLKVADTIMAQNDLLLIENQKDLNRMDPSNPLFDRLRLTQERLAGIASDMRSVALLPSPLGRILAESVQPNGIKIRKVSVPFGVIGIIYEARPNVGFDVFSLCLKSGNASILKGSSNAHYSNTAIVSLIRDSLASEGFDPNSCILLPVEREATTALLHARQWVDLIIPRGSSNLIKFVRDNARVPVIETGAGICHTYFDKTARTSMGAEIINNAKTRRVSVCNSLDCMIIHRDRLHDLPQICKLLSDSNVIIYADEAAFDALEGGYPPQLLKQATAESFGTEFLDYKMSIRTVASLREAIDHITTYSSKHSETIISEDREAIIQFEKEVDAACVYSNVSTAFTDGAQFGLGAEIGISTQKLHARGPMGLNELTSYKYIIDGDGQIRKP